MRHHFGARLAVCSATAMNGRATDVTSRTGAAALAPVALSKTLFLDIRAALNAHGVTDAQIPSKLEGMAFGQDVMVKAQAKGPLSSPAYLKAVKKNRELSQRQGIDAVMTKLRLDALVAPTSGPAWPIDLPNGDSSAGGGFSPPAAVAGYPHITVPAGYVFGLPVGLSFVGGAFSEPALIRFACAYEQATKFRKPPQFLRTVKL